MASNDAGSRNICARLVLNEKGTLTITEDPTASIPSTKRNQLLSVTGPGGEVKEFFYGKAPNIQAAPRINPPDKTDSTHVSTSTPGPNKSVLTESQAKSLAVMLSSVNSHVTANEHWVLDHSYTMKEKMSLAPPVVILAPPVVVPPKQTKEESQPGKKVFESVKCSPSSIKPSVYGSANESSYEIMTSPPSYSTGHQSSGSSLQAVSGHLPKPHLLPTCSTTTEGGASTENRQSKSEGASEILRQLSASVPVTVGHTSSLTTGPRFQSSQGLNRIPQTTVSNKQGNRPSILGGTGNLKSKQTGSQMGNMILKPTGVLGSLRDMVTANLKDKGQDVSFNAQSGKDVLSTTQTVSLPSKKTPLNVPVQKRHYPGGAYVDTYPQVRQKNIHNQNDIDPVLQKMLKNVQKASACLKETLPVPVSDAFNSNVTPPCKPQSYTNVPEKGHGPKEVIVRVYPDKPVVAVKPDPMKPVNPQSVLPVLTAPQIAFVPDTMQTYYMPVVMTQTSNSFPLVYNQCVPSGSAGKTIIVTTNTQNQVPMAPATNRETLPTNANEHGPVNNKGISFSVPSKPEPKIDAFIDQHNYAAVPQEVDMALPRIESVFSLTHSQDIGTQKQDLNKDILKVTPNSETDSCLNPGKTKLRKVESVKIEDSSESSSCLNPGKTKLRKVESVKIEDSSESSSCLNPGKTKLRKVESVKIEDSSESSSCLNPGKTKLRKVESVKIEDSSESSSCLNPGKTKLRNVESARIDDNSESSSCLNPGKTKVRKVESVKSGKDSQYHTTVVQTGQSVGDTKPINENDALSGFNSSTIQDSNDDGLTPKKRNRKVPKRLKTDYPSSSPKNAHKLKLNMRPLIFHPCFVVVERISIPSNLKLAKRKNKKNKENEICPLECREMFLRRLCEKRHLPGNQCKLKVVEDKNKQGKHEPSVSRTVQAKRRINTDDDNKPANPTQEKQDGPASLHESASHQPGELVTVGTFNISSSNGSKYAVEVPNMVPSPGAFETIGKPTVISTLPLNQGTLNVSESCQSKMESVCLDSDRSPRSPSSETESAASVAYVESDFSDTSPVKSPEVISRTDESKTHTIILLEKFDGFQTASLPSSETKESVVQNELILSLGSSHLGAPSPIDPSEESSKYVEPCSVPENEENFETKIKGDVKEDVEEDSDEEWMNVELEVDPDSEPDEEMDMFLPETPAPTHTPDPELELEPGATTTEISSASISNVVLSDKVQRLKAMLAEKMKQVDNLRKQRQIPN